MASLSATLRERTAEAHRRAEETQLIADLMAGAACGGAFAALARQHLEIYGALEETIETHYPDHPIVATVLDPRLLRHDLLRGDLDAIELTPLQRERVLDEAERAFDLNRQVFLGLAANREPTHIRVGVAS